MKIEEARDTLLSGAWIEGVFDVISFEEWDSDYYDFNARELTERCELVDLAMFNEHQDVVRTALPAAIWRLRDIRLESMIEAADKNEPFELYLGGTASPRRLDRSQRFEQLNRLGERIERGEEKIDGYLGVERSYR